MLLPILALNTSLPCNRESFRSAVPDLLFEEVRDTRVVDIMPYLDRLENVNAETPLHRVTVFLTYRCNLDCPYCKTIARSKSELQAYSQKAISYTIRSFQNLLDSLAGTPIHHLHFTGGEATMVTDLPEMLRVARKSGVNYLSITSNGTLDKQVYVNLIKNGIDEIRISIDAADPEVGETLTRRKGAWESAVSNIKFLGKYRNESTPFHLIANTVVTSTNKRRLPEIVRFLISLGVDDMKLITVVQEKDELGDFIESKAVCQEIEEILQTYPPEAFPLLRMKINTVFAAEAIGLAGVEPAKDNQWRCYIPLTERTVDGVYYYPCSVYLREGGEPLGRIDEPQQLQREKTAAFVSKSDCLSDPICHNYCLHCTRNYNIAANNARISTYGTPSELPLPPFPTRNNDKRPGEYSQSGT